MAQDKNPLSARIRFRGFRRLNGLFQKACITIGRETFYSYRRFPEQDEEGRYIRPLSFFETNREILDDKRLFEVSFVPTGADG